MLAVGVGVEIEKCQGRKRQLPEIIAGRQKCRRKLEARQNGKGRKQVEQSSDYRCVL